MTVTQQIAMDAVRREASKLDGLELVALHLQKTHVLKFVEIANDSILYRHIEMTVTQQIAMDVARREMLKLDGLELVALHLQKTHVLKFVEIANDLIL